MSKLEESNSPSFKTGFTWRVLFALILAAVLFLPVSLYVNLVAGATIAAAAVYVIVLIFSSFSQYYGANLSKQELFLIYATVGSVAGFIPPYYYLVFRAYFVQSPFTRIFSIGGVPIPDLVPEWLTPKAGSEAYVLRTFFHADFIPSLTLITLMSILTFLAEWSLGMLLSYTFIEVEKMPFPFAQIDSSLVTTLSERKVEDMQIFVLTLAIGTFLGGVIYIPYLLGVPLVPLPFIDLTEFTEKVLPGAIIGISTNPALFVSGFIIPPSLTLCVLIGSIATWIIGNTVLLQFFPNAFPKWAQEYYTGMTILPIYQRSLLRVWIGFQFGVSIGFAALLSLLLSKSIARTIRSLTKAGKSAASAYYPPAALLIGAFLGTTLISVLIHHFLIPEYPVIVSLTISVIFSFLVSIVTSRSAGEIGVTPVIEWPWNIATYFTDYKGFAGWWFTPVISTGGVSRFVAATKAAYLTETKPIDYYKAMFVGYLLSLALGFTFMEFFWRAAEIPSAAYPYTAIFWPTTAMSYCLFATREISITLQTILSGAAIGATVAALGIIFSRLHIPFSSVGIVTGLFTLPTDSIMLCIGSFVGNYFISRFLGRDKWLRLRPVIAAGFLAGMSISIGIGIAGTMLTKAAWIWPW